MVKRESLLVRQGKADQAEQQWWDEGQAHFSVDSITDPTGAPTQVLDLELGVTITGQVTIPNWIEGTGQVCVYVDEIGGPFNQALGCDTLTFTRRPSAKPARKKYPWEITILPNVLPDLQLGSSQVYNMTAVFIFDDQVTQIAGVVDMGNYLIT